MSFYDQPQRILLPVKAGFMALTLVLALVTLLVTYVPWISLGVVNLFRW